jgi:hypothetical protein
MMPTDFVGVDIFTTRAVAEQVAQSYRMDNPPRQNVQVIETNRLMVFDCPAGIASCERRYEKRGTPLFIVYSEL